MQAQRGRSLFTGPASPSARARFQHRKVLQSETTMKNAFYLIAFVLALGMAYALSQTAPSAAPPAPSSSTANASTENTADTTLQTQVRQHFAGQNLDGVNVAVSDGVVTLTGSVPSKEDRKRAKELAKSVAGVKEVKEKLTIDATASAAPATNAQATAPVSSNAAS